MKVVVVVPRSHGRPTLKTLLDETERRLRGHGTTLIRQKAGRWVHAKYDGWINWDLTKGNVLVAEVASRSESEWQLLQAFISYLDRHLGEHIDTISIRYC